MGPEFLLALIGPVAGGFVGISTFLLRRNLTVTEERLHSISENVEVIAHQMTSLQLKIAESYVTKDDLIRHIQSEERWQNEVLGQLQELREDMNVQRRNQ